MTPLITLPFYSAPVTARPDAPRRCEQCGRRLGIDPTNKRSLRHFCRPMLESESFPGDGSFRYWLLRRWGDGPHALWVLANPSTADGETDDATITEVCRFTHEVAGCKAAVVVNLYAKRATKPTALKGSENLVGESDLEFTGAVENPAVIIVGWGQCLVNVIGRDQFAQRVDDVEEMLAKLGDIYALGRNEPRTRSGLATPWHPLHAARQRPRPDALQRWSAS